jgi:hypothetical protein
MNKRSKNLIGDKIAFMIGSIERDHNLNLAHKAFPGDLIPMNKAEQPKIPILIEPHPRLYNITDGHQPTAISISLDDVLRQDNAPRLITLTDIGDVVEDLFLFGEEGVEGGRAVVFAQGE